MHVSRPYPPISFDGFVTEHDRPYSEYGHLGSHARKVLQKRISNTDIDNRTIAHRFHFDLADEKTGERRRLNNRRLSRHIYAITCRTQTDSQSI